MKFSVILVSLTLPIAAQSAAQAQEPGTATFLKSSISANEAATPQKKAKLQLSDLRAEAQTVASSASKLRPFVPNRKLPRQRDLDYQLMAQTARMAAPAAPLSAQISEFAAYNAPAAAPFVVDTTGVNRSIATYDAITLAKAWAPRVMPGQSATIPGQVRVNRSARSRQTQAATTNPDWFGQAGAGERVIGQGAGLLVQAPAMAPNEQQVSDRMAELGYPSASEIQGAAEPAANIPQDIVRPVSLSTPDQSTAGPAPFPLNMLPQDKLKDLINSRTRNRVQAPKAYFGSWHGGPQGLPAAGFHSNIHSRGFSAPSAPPRYASQPAAPRVAMNFAPKPAARPTGGQMAPLRRSSQINQVSRSTQISPQPVQVATYAPYALQPHSATN